METTALNPAQQAILMYAHAHTDGRLDWFPENIKGGARQKVLEGLRNRGLIDTDGQHCFISLQGYAALGVPRTAALSQQAIKQVLKAEQKDQAPNAEAPVRKDHRTRENSKQASVIALLQRPEGATIAQICQATQWQSHTVRGTLAGNLKKRLGLVITSSKEPGGQRVYRIETTATEPEAA